MIDIVLMQNYNDYEYDSYNDLNVDIIIDIGIYCKLCVNQWIWWYGSSINASSNCIAGYIDRV